MQLTLKRTYPNIPHNGETQWTVMMTGYAYSVGHVQERGGKWTPYNVGRRDWGMPHIESPSFDTREQACAHIRQVLEDGEAKAHKAVAEALALLTPFMKPVECTDERYRDAIIVVKLLSPFTHLGVTTTMTPAETLNALDHLWDLSGDWRMQVVVEGMLMDQQMVDTFRGDPNRYAYAKWTIPVGSNDYHLPGWRSRSGLGRRKGE